MKMENVVSINNIQLINADCLYSLKTLEDSSVDLILTDPPYFKVKRDAWDNQWHDVNDFFSWFDEVLFELYRVLKPNGSIYVFCGSKLAADTEILMRERFNVLNHIVWAKPSGIWNKTRKESLRMYAPATERIIFAEHYGADGFAKGASGYHSKKQEARENIFSPLIHYFKSARESLNISAKEINEATGKQMCSHWFSYSQWQLPSESDYKKLQSLFQKKGSELNKEYSELNKEYSELNKEYSELKKEYQSLRRVFNVSSSVPFTDVFCSKSVQFYPGKHTCEKPSEMLEHMISATTNEGALVLDAFMGSGSTGKACVKLNRKFVGIEFEEELFNQTVNEFQLLIKESRK